MPGPGLSKRQSQLIVLRVVLVKRMVYARMTGTLEQLYRKALCAYCCVNRNYWNLDNKKNFFIRVPFKAAPVLHCNAVTAINVY